ncbi:MAG: hypothetical protein AB7C89_07710 [Intestinibacillus sp.]
MFFTLERSGVGCSVLRAGIHKISRLAQNTYGTRKKIQFSDKDGTSQYSTDLGYVLQHATMQDQEMKAAAGLLTSEAMPEDGVKTAVLLIHAFLERAQEINLSEQNVYNSMPAILDTMKVYLHRIAREHDGLLPGSGLYLMNLMRPLLHLARTHVETKDAVHALIAVLSLPMKVLAVNAGADPCEVYERIKTLAPNQFFSLNHFGLERSIDREDSHTDVFSFGIDISDGKIKDVFDADIAVPLDTGIAVLDYWGSITKQFHSVSEVLQ